MLLYDLASRRTTTLNDGSTVNSVSFNPDGTILASGDDNGQVVFFVLADGKTTTINEPRGPVHALAFSRDGKTLAIVDNEGQIVFVGWSAWDATATQVERQLCQELGDVDMTPTQWAAYIPDQPYYRTCP